MQERVSKMTRLPNFGKKESEKVVHIFGEAIPTNYTFHRIFSSFKSFNVIWFCFHLRSDQIY